jgi:hypothetical protein
MQASNARLCRAEARHHPGLQFTVDGQSAQAAKQFLSLSAGSRTLAVETTQAGTPGTQLYVFSWSDGGAATHSIITVATGVAATYVAYLKAQYHLTTAVSPAAAGSVSPASGAFYDARSRVTLTATASTPFVFSSWSGGTNPVIMNVPQSVTASLVNPTLACNITGDNNTSVGDVQAMVNEALGFSKAQNDLSGDGVVNVVDVRIVIESALGKTCFAS